MEPWQTIMLLGAVAIVCAAVYHAKQYQIMIQQTTSQTVRNMETALESFMENMESDNRQMVELVTKSSKTHKHKRLTGRNALRHLRNAALI